MIDRSDYEFLAQLLQAQSGLALGPGKEYLLESRLEPIASSLGFPALEALVRVLRRGEDRALVRTVCEAMTTNESFFFRDSTPFRAFQETILPQLLEARRTTRRLRIWSAAASTGQEPYTLAMILDQAAPAVAGWNVEILATDYSRPALNRAREGIYNHFEVQRGLPIQYLAKYFQKVGDDWQVNAALRRAVTFREANLLESFSSLGRFDIVFCRNVLIYFDVPTKADVLNRIAQVTAPDGYLVLGGSETAMGISERFERVATVATSLYRPTPEPIAQARFAVA